MPAKRHDVKLYNNIPDELKTLDQWVLWKEVSRDGNKTKLPFVASGKGTKTAESNNRLTWRSFKQAVSLAERLGVGIGFVFSEDDPYIGIDVDNKKNDAEKAEDNEFWKNKFNTYSELSPSGLGMHFIVKGPALKKGINSNGFEAYSKGRYFTFTGEVVVDQPIREGGKALEDFVTTFGSGGGDGSGKSLQLADVIFEGARDDQLYRLGCSLRKRGYTPKEVNTIIRTMGKGLEQPEQDLDRVMRSIEAPEDYDDELMSYQDLAEKVVIHVKSEDKYWDQPSYQLITHNCMDRAYQGRLKPIGEGEDAKRPLPSKVVPFLEQHRTVDKLSWMPGESTVFELRGELVVNQYRPPLTRGKRGKLTKPWIEHLKWLIPDKALREHVLDWMAYTVQTPKFKINHSLLFGGAPRIGKDMLFNPLRVAVGEHNVREPKTKDLESDFNWYEQNAKLIIVQEIHGFHQMEQEDKLKSMLASPPETCTVNVKNTKQYQQPNVSSVIFMTNHAQPLRVSEGNQARYCCVWCAPEQPKDHTYYTDLYEWYMSGGLEAVVYMLNHRKLSKFAPGAEPVRTTWANDLLDSSQSEEDELLDHSLNHRDGIWEYDVIPSANVQSWCKSEGHKFRTFSAAMRKRGMVRRNVTVRTPKGVYGVRVWLIRDISVWEGRGPSEVIDYVWQSFPGLKPQARGKRK